MDATTETEPCDGSDFGGRFLLSHRKSEAFMTLSPIPPDEFPSTGLWSVDQFCTARGVRSIFPASRTVFLRHVSQGDYPPPVRIGNLSFWHAEHVRAIAAGLDWRRVKLDLPEMVDKTKRSP
jgi:predicted DNA-binding transcriptional regulator AlpA